jgi:TMEM175 potassium channel family protein
MRAARGAGSARPGASRRTSALSPGSRAASGIGKEGRVATFRAREPSYVRRVAHANHRGDGEEPGLPTQRIEALADGIFAVAMTILVLELHVPELGREVSEAGLLAALEHLWPKALSFVSGFVVLGTLWIGHHFQFNYIRRSTRAILWINIAFLLAISFLPFVIALIGAYGAMRVSCILYGATLVFAMTCLLVQWRYAAGGPRRLVGPALPPDVFLGLRNRVLMGMIGYGIGVLFALVAPTVSLICYATTPLLYLLPARFDRNVRVQGAHGRDDAGA